MPLALDKRNEASSNNKNVLPLLHPSCMEKMVFVKYLPPPCSTEAKADYDAWLERINYLSSDLHWLLQLSHDKFWCQVIFDDTLHKALDSFLTFCPRSYDNVMSLTEAGQQSQHELSRLVYLTYLRMATHKESKENFITPEVFGEIIYENFLFDIPKLLDICSLFGKSNGALLSKMITNIFTQQPKYTDDLREIVPTIIHVLTNISTQCGVQLETNGQSPQKLDKVPSLSSMPLTALQDILLYLNDTALTLQRFLELYPPACKVFHEFHFCSVIATFYEHVIPELNLALKQNQILTESLQKQLQAKLRKIKKCLVQIFRAVLQHNCIQPLLDHGGNEEVVSGCIEDLLHTLTTVLNERKFLASYESLFNFQDDVDLLMNTSASIDAQQLDYIQSAINSAFSRFGHRKSPRGDTNTGGRTSPDGAADSGGSTVRAGKAHVRDDVRDDGPERQWEKEENFPAEFQTENFGEGAVSCPTPGQTELESLITSVKDLFPHIGEGFIQLALEELEWNHEKVVSAILEDKLPPSLQGISFDIPRQEREVNQGDGQGEGQKECLAEVPDVLASRRNIFDNDEFDIFQNKKVDMTKIHLGKKKEKIDLEDKSVIKAIQATYDAYGNIDQESMYDSPQMYEDEYDDTYDSNLAADDADSADELTNHKVLPRVLMDLERKKEREATGDSEESEEDEETENEIHKDLFLTDPAKLREMAEQKRLSQVPRGRRGRGGTGPPRVRDVVGNAKGQGQSDEVKHNRRMKEKFKGQRTRFNAEKKMSKGMF